MKSRFKAVLLTAAVGLCPLLLSGAVYTLPGANDTNLPTNGATDAGLRQLARDSNGFWYVVWENSSQTDVVMAYTTTTTPSNASHWGLFTLVDNGGTGAIAAAPANNAGGFKPNIAITRDDQLYLAWKMVSGTQAGYYASTCSNLSAVTTPASWSAPIRLDPGGVQPTLQARLSMVLDRNDVPHAAFLQGNPTVVSYTKYDTATAAWLAPITLNATSSDELAITSDHENNVYVAWKTFTSDLYLLASQDADVNAPAASTWKDLAQTTTDADKVNATLGITAGGPDVLVDRNGFLHVAWVDDLASSDDVEGRQGLIRDGWNGVDADIDAGAFKKMAKLSAAGNGDVYAVYAVQDGATNADDIFRAIYSANTAYRSPGAWGGEGEIEGEGADNTEFFVTQHRQWPQHASVLYLYLDDGANRMMAADWPNVPVSTAGWRPPRPTKNLDHPHLAWVFPDTSGDLGPQNLPVVSQTSKGAVYVADNLAAGRVYALDRSAGTVARSFTFTGTPGMAVGATYGLNVHLFVQHNANAIMKLTDDGTSLVSDGAWANNPLTLTGATGMLPPLFTIQSGVRYLYALGDGSGVSSGLFKLKADNGVVLGGFPVGDGSYQANYLEPQFRLLNDQVFLAGISAQIYRREADGSAEIMSSAVANVVLHLLQVRNNNRIFLAPDDKAVWQLDSGLKTADWTGGTSANLGVVKTSGAYYSARTNVLFVGAGNQLYKLNGADGSLMANWPMATVGNIVSLPVEWKTFVYFGTDSGRLYAVNASSNVARANWPVLLDATVSTPKPTYLAFDAVTGHVYFATNEGRVYKLATE